MKISPRKMAVFGLAIGVIVAFGASFFYLHTRPVQVTVAPIETNVPIQVFGLGTVEAQHISKIGFEAPGTLIELKADHGDGIQAGMVLARLQSREQDAKVMQARAAMAQAKAGVEQAEAAVEKAEAVVKQKAETNERRQQLVHRGVVSQEIAGDTQAGVDIAKAELSQSRSAVSVARANLEQAAAVLALEEARLEKYTLAAPFNGVVMARHKELGSALNANEPVFTVVDPASMWALAYFDEARSGLIEVGQSATVVRRSALDRPMTAKVVRIDIESDRVNEERRVYLRCSGCPLRFHIGEQAEVLITIATVPRARFVRTGAILNPKGREAVAWTVEDGRLQQRKVTLGQRTIDGRMEIVSGIPEGAEVVVSPLSGLNVGRKATIKTAEEKAR
jgi:HlyD family secretion protein